MTTAIHIENLWKEYRLGVIDHGTFTQDLQSWWARIRGKEDPNSIIDPYAAKNSKRLQGDRFWALRDVCLSVNHGEVLGIIGKNGAGKSTLLKILSRVTAPSRGIIRARGRIASLLEVGTGFHPELTGRENIFLNGSILGMSKLEIREKFDEILEFSGVEAFVDTPVKRYSSGMYVRLAFAVAAHLDPEILVVDEVLAVGDAQFQKKCIGKMENISREGRTILFVSHNLAAIKSLCSRGVVLEEGQVRFLGNVDQAVVEYVGEESAGQTEWDWSNSEHRPGNEWLGINAVTIAPLNGKIIDIDSGFSVTVEFINKISGVNLDFTSYLTTSENVVVFESGIILHFHRDSREGMYRVTGEIPPYLLNCGKYRMSFLFGRDQRQVLLRLDDLIQFTIENTATGRGSNLGKSPGIIRPQLKWTAVLPD